MHSVSKILPQKKKRKEKENNIKAAKNIGNIHVFKVCKRGDPAPQCFS
jgi:hypothetical protein